MIGLTSYTYEYRGYVDLDEYTSNLKEEAIYRRESDKGSIWVNIFNTGK
jgi:hypothetical protein